MTRTEAIYWLNHDTEDRVKFFTAVGYAIEYLKADEERDKLKEKAWTEYLRKGTEE